MTVSKVVSVWTAFIAALAAIVRVLGFGGNRAVLPSGTPVRTAASARPVAAGQVATLPSAEPAAVSWHSWRPGRVRALPPTIKQRIRAEAHGSSPAVRRTAAVGARLAVPADAGYGLVA
ncbi:DUF6344 domain-containing protein [Streptomyces sp. NPDC006879]|uniref:DUF6344 domain-containing protein n=1 Tax=Streptomyces sp. NPDC006879 TaxID=3364767 RepID=UPI0036BFEB96